MPLSILFAVTIFVTGVALGAIIAALWARGRMAEIDAGRRVAEANLMSAQGGLNKMTETFQAAADTALRATQQSFLDSARSTLEMVRTEMAGEMTQRQTAVEGVVRPIAETLAKQNGPIRPDVIVRLPGQRTLVVDAKVPLTAFLDAAAATSDADRHNAMMRHSQQVTKHIDQLSAKSYWNQFQPAPEFVVLFLPGDHFFSAA